MYNEIDPVYTNVWYHPNKYKINLEIMDKNYTTIDILHLIYFIVGGVWGHATSH